MEWCFFLAVLAAILAVSVFLTNRNVIRQMDKLENRAYRDTLTGLQNRQAFYDDCAMYDNAIGAVASLDMNGLKARFGRPPKVVSMMMSWCSFMLPTVW